MATAQWWIEPTADLWPDLADALRIDVVDLDAVDTARDQVRLTWATTVRILDAEAVRSLARDTCTDPAGHADIDRSFAPRGITPPTRPHRSPVPCTRGLVAPCCAEAGMPVARRVGTAPGGLWARIRAWPRSTAM